MAEPVGRQVPFEEKVTDQDGLNESCRRQVLLSKFATKAKKEKRPELPIWGDVTVHKGKEGGWEKRNSRQAEAA